MGIQCGAPDPGHLFNVGRAALATFDLHRFDANGRQLRQQVEGVEAGGFFQRMEALAADQEAAFAQGRITGRFFGGVAVDQHLAQACAEALGILAPAHRLGGRADAAQVRRFAGDVGRQVATAFSHDAQAAETEDFDRHRTARRHLSHLGQGQYPRQHGAADVIALGVKSQGRRVGRRALYRQVQRQFRMALAGVAEHAGVGGDQGVHAEVGGAVHCPLPALPALGLRVSIDRHVQLALMLTDVCDSRVELLVVHVQPGKMPGIGIIAKADIDGIGALAHRRFEGRQIPCRANQLHGASS
ncbi:hypothetical protein D3C84_554570 [compost metagenome]